jgi:hypothetical protein
MCTEDAVRFLTRKFQRWGVNAPLVESLISAMFEERGSSGDPSPSSWLDHVIRYVAHDLDIPLQLSSFHELRESVLGIDPALLRQRITNHCHRTCFPPSPRRETYYQSLNIRTSASWPCFRSAAPHLKLCRFFISNSFSHSRLLVQNSIDEECPACNVRISVQHWLSCPLRVADRALLASETGFEINSLECLRNVLQNPRHSVALEFVLHRYFYSQ